MGSTYPNLDLTKRKMWLSASCPHRAWQKREMVQEIWVSNARLCQLYQTNVHSPWRGCLTGNQLWWPPSAGWQFWSNCTELWEFLPLVSLRLECCQRRHWTEWWQWQQGWRSWPMSWAPLAGKTGSTSWPRWISRGSPEPCKPANEKKLPNRLLVS